MSTENRFIKSLFKKLSIRYSTNKAENECNAKEEEEQLGKRSVRFCNNVSVIEYNREVVVPTDEIWYSPDDINQFQTDICDFVQSLRKQKVYDFYNNESLELLLTTTPSNNKHHRNKQTKRGSNNSNGFSIRGIEYLIDGKKLQIKNMRIDEGVKAVLNEQKKQQQQQRKGKKRSQKTMKKDKQIFVLDFKAISECYIENSQTVECQKEANERGMQNMLDIMSMNNKIVPNLAKLIVRSATTPAARSIVAQRNRRVAARAVAWQKY